MSCQTRKPPRLAIFIFEVSASALMANTLPLVPRINKSGYAPHIPTLRKDFLMFFVHIQIWDIASRTILNVYDGHQQEIYSLDYSRDGRLIVSGSGDRTARIWDTKDPANNKICELLHLYKVIIQIRSLTGFYDHPPPSSDYQRSREH